jgi:SAM-dependent methyltransferase
VPPGRSIDYGKGASVSFAALTDPFRPVAQAIADRLPALTPHAQLVDLACGPGEPGLSVLERYPAAELLGVDTSEAMLEIARGRAAGKTNVRFAKMDMEELDMPAAGQCRRRRVPIRFPCSRGHLAKRCRVHANRTAWLRLQHRRMGSA